MVELEQGIHKKDNQLLQRLEQKLGVWLTGGSDRIGTPTPKAEKQKKKAAHAKTTSKKDQENVNKDGEKKESGDDENVSTDEAVAMDDSETDKKDTKAKKV